MRLVLVSANAHKLRELRAALPGWDVAGWDGPELPPETGSTFLANARGKAEFGRSTGDPRAWVAGEDSGLEVDGLGGAPGVYSARYAGEGATDAENVEKLLRELGSAEGDGRRARYRATIVALSPQGEEVVAEGALEGRVAAGPSGSGGFGYDPVFVPEGETRTVAELGDAWKAASSHRARAARALAARLGEQAGTV
jgi:XTP/dITP diphosphohydrolase